MLDGNDITTRWLSIYMGIIRNWNTGEFDDMVKEIYEMIFINYTRGNMKKNSQIEMMEKLRKMREQRHGSTFPKNLKEIQ
jgi:hypothetical protein